MLILILVLYSKIIKLSSNPSMNIEDNDKMIDEDEEIGSSQRAMINKEKLVRKWIGSIDDTYIIDQKLGEGSFGTVFLVTHKQLKVKRALKIIKKSSKSSSDPKDEMQILKKLDHPNIIKLYEYYQSKDKWYIVTQFFQGCQLFDQIISQGTCTEQQTAKIIYEVLKALKYIHSNHIAHRDIKAQNILVRKTGTQYTIKMIDWGLGVLTKGEDLYRRCGTPEYCAPQVLSGCYNIECDMWSLGVLVYIMLSGCMPFKGANINQTISIVKKGQVAFKPSVWQTVSKQAKSFILKLLQKDVQQRLTASQCLEQKWIKDNIQSQTNEVNLQGTLQRLKQFRNQNRLHIIVVNYILNFIEAPHQIQRLKQQFQLIDTNKDGAISFQELLTAYKRIYGVQAQLIVQQIFKTVDLDGSGLITFSQFITFASMATYDFNKQQLKSAFKMFDLDSDGHIDKKQLSNLIQYERRSTEKTQFDSIINSIDINNDGKIDLQEFINHVQQVSIKINTKTSSIQSASKQIQPTVSPNKKE